MVKPRPALALPFLGCSLLFSARLHAQEAIAFDRPGMGFSTSTLPRGGVAWEQGFPDLEISHDGNMQSRLLMADTLLRVGLTDTLELQVGTDGYGWLSADNGVHALHAQGMGNTNLGLKQALPAPRDEVSLALLAGVTLPTGHSPIGGGNRAYTLGISAEWDLGQDRSLGLYIDRGFAGDRGWLLAPSYGFALCEHWAGYVEAGVGTGDREGRMLGVGATWQPRPRVQFDLSVLHGQSGAPDWQGGLGVSVYFP